MASQDSQQLKNSAAGIANPATDDNGRVRSKYFKFTQEGAGADGDSANLVRLPGGNCRVLRSYLAHSALGAARALDLGWAAYSDSDQVEQAADPNGLAAAADVSAAGDIAADHNQTFDSGSGVTITATVNGGTIPAGATFEGHIVYVQA